MKEELIKLKSEEKKYFDTYKTKRDNIEKAIHLEKMANVIRRIDEVEKQIKFKRNGK